MKKKKNLLFAGISLAFVLMAGCSSAPKEDEIKDDLAKCADQQLLSDGEVLDSIEITDRNTDKKQKIDSILCEVTTHKGDVSYEKGVEITYYKYDKNWELGNISVSDEDSWLMKPLKGVDAEVIADALVSERIMIDGQNWDIETGEIKNVTVDNRKSDLENNKEEVSLTLTLDSGVEEAKGTLTADFEFDKNWEMVSCNPNDDFKVTPNLNKTLNLTEDDLIGLLSEQIFDYDENGIGKQEISVTKDQVSDFKIDNQKTINKGKYQEYQCSCTFSKANAVFGIEFTVESQYDSEWSSVVTSKKLQVESVDWAGKWTGRYNNVPYSGDAGFIRRVTNVSKKNDVYVYETEPALLTDVFEEAHIIRRFQLTEEGVEEDDFSENKNDIINNSSFQNSTYSVIQLTEEDSNSVFREGDI